MGITKKESQLNRQLVNNGLTTATDLLDATNTASIIRFGAPMSKVSFQAGGTLAGTVEFSLNGINWVNSTAIAGGNAIATFSTHNVAAIKVTRSGGSGNLFIAAIS